MSQASRLVLLALAIGAVPAQAQTVQLAPFAGFQFGGSFVTPAGAAFELHDSLDYGGGLDVAISSSWRVGLLYSRQDTELRGPGPSFDLSVERLMASLVEERGEGTDARFFGEALFGVTRFVSGLGGYDTDSRFTLGVGLGLKRFFSEHFGVRGQVRGLYTFTEADGGVFCVNGECLFLFSGSGLWQGEVSGGLVIGF
jgi:hypothetical protein